MGTSMYLSDLQRLSGPTVTGVQVHHHNSVEGLSRHVVLLPLPLV
jgi:hypothetical protein